MTHDPNSNNDEQKIDETLQETQETQVPEEQVPEEQVLEEQTIVIAEPEGSILPESSPESSSNQEEIKDLDSDGRFKEGQLLSYVKVRFPGNAKAFPFFTNNKQYAYGQKVVAMSDRGMAVGIISSFPYDIPFTKDLLPINTIVKVATEQDVEKDLSTKAKEKEAKDLCQDLVNKLKLDMELTHVEYTQFGKKAVFYFTAPGRVDFRELVKELVSSLKMRIELRQIYIRDRTAGIGGIGPCGLQICCSTFLPKYGNVNIKMAKNQNVTLAPNKLNGICGQLKCCMAYEDDVYTDKRGLLPEIGQFICTKNGDRGKVEKLEILAEEFQMLTDQGIRRLYTREQYLAEEKLPETWQFPSSFEFITNETYHVIGKNAMELESLKQESNTTSSLPSAEKEHKETKEAREQKEQRGHSREREAYSPRKHTAGGRHKHQNQQNQQNQQAVYLYGPDEMPGPMPSGANFKDDGVGLLSHQLGASHGDPQSKNQNNHRSHFKSRSGNQRSSGHGATGGSPNRDSRHRHPNRSRGNNNRSDS